MDLVQHLRDSFAKSEREESKLPEDIYRGVRGMSTEKVRHLLNNVCELPDLRYLEIGTWQGSTLCSSLYGNEGVFYAIDNFVKNFDKYEGVSVKDLLFDNLQRFDLQDKVKFFNEDCFKMDLNNIEHKINVYFYDGEHSDGSQNKALTYFKPVLDEEFIYIVDDWRDRGEGNPTGATKGTFKAIEEGFEQIEYFEAPRGGYHMGLGLFVLRKK